MHLLIFSPELLPPHSQPDLSDFSLQSRPRMNLRPLLSLSWTMAYLRFGEYEWEGREVGPCGSREIKGRIVRGGKINESGVFPTVSYYQWALSTGSFFSSPTLWSSEAYSSFTYTMNKSAISKLSKNTQRQVGIEILCRGAGHFSIKPAEVSLL